MATPDSQPYINAIASASGFVLDYHMIMAHHDVAMFKAINDMRETIHFGSALDKKTRELVYVVGYTTAGFQREHLAWHTRAALTAGATAEELYQAFAIVEQVVGIDLAMRGMDVLAGVTELGAPIYDATEGADPLGRRIQQILLALSAAVNCGREAEVARHTAAAVQAGASPKEVLDAFEFLPLISGVIPFMHAVETWSAVTGAEGIEPTVPFFVMNNDGTPRSLATPN